MATTEHSRELFDRARQLIPGGVDSPVRAFNAVGGTPRFFAKGEGAHIQDVDGNDYIDYVLSFGPLIHGHAFPPVVEAITAAARAGTSFGAPVPAEVRLAELITDAMPSVEMVRFVSSGTEATMTAIRLARAATGRDLIVKFAGNYHGHADALLAEAGSGGLTLGIPSSPGVPQSIAQNTIVLPYNDQAALEEVFSIRQGEIAAVIVELVAGNMGVVPPRPGFLDAIARLTRESGALFIADEVITGFRVAQGGAQEIYHLRPDLTTLGKIIGGGLPVGAFGGRRDLMERMAPTGPVYQAGTLSGNPLAMSAGIAAVDHLDPEFYGTLQARTERLAAGLREAAERAGIPLTVNAVTGMLTPFFTAGPVLTLDDAKQSDTANYAQFFHALLDRGIYPPPSQFEAWMLSSRHTDEVIAETIRKVEAALHSL